MSRVKKSNVAGEKNTETRGDRKGQAFSINCRVTIRPVLREIAALYLNMNINDISLCWVFRALTFWFLLILVWCDYITAVVHLLASELSATLFGLYICRTPNNDFTTQKHQEWFVRLAHASKTAAYHKHKSDTVVLLVFSEAFCRFTSKRQWVWMLI